MEDTTYQVFDTIQVYDTIKVFDTIKIFNNVVIYDTIQYVDTTNVIKVIESCSNSSNTSLLSTILTFSALLIAALIALYQVRSNTIASARIKKINTLNDLASKLAVYINDCHYLIKDKKLVIRRLENGNEEEIKRHSDEMYDGYLKLISKIEELSFRLILAINMGDDLGREIDRNLRLIKRQLGEFVNADINYQNQIQLLSNNILKNVKKIMNEEWRKVFLFKRKIKYDEND